MALLRLHIRNIPESRATGKPARQSCDHRKGSGGFQPPIIRSCDVNHSIQDCVRDERTRASAAGSHRYASVVVEPEIPEHIHAPTLRVELAD